MLNVIAVLPAYEPDIKLIEIVDWLRGRFRGVLVVDDGSCRSQAVFKGLPRAENVILVSHPVNRGKGAALKTAFAEVLDRFPDAAGVLTLDADGQHRTDDAFRVAAALCESPTQLVLGVRRFGKDIPFRSHLGNLWTIAEFRLLTGHLIHDTQSGLRGIPLCWLPQLMAIPGDRYDYEIRMLVAAARTMGGVTEVPIATIYDKGNTSSHFRPLADTISTQGALFAAALNLH